jgi:hypothetical protein
MARLKLNKNYVIISRCIFIDVNDDDERSMPRLDLNTMTFIAQEVRERNIMQ